MAKRHGRKSGRSGNAVGEKRPGAAPNEASQYLLFALLQLAGENGHHKFEQLCFQLARRRIYPNVIPATGPVGAGGDQGADFESYEVSATYFPWPRGRSSLRERHAKKVLFACSLEQNVPKKIKEDLTAASQFHEKVDKLVFFSSRDVPVGKLDTNCKLLLQRPTRYIWKSSMHARSRRCWPIRRCSG